MRFRLFLALTSATLLSAGLAIQACGGSTDSGTTTTPDSSVAADTFTPPHDAATDTADAAPGCDPTTDYLGEVPDASLADGESSTGVCIACAKAMCGTEISACGSDCNCQQVATDLLQCYGTTQDLTTCASKLIMVPASTRTLGTNLFTCIVKDCATECAVDAFLDAGDGGD